MTREEPPHGETFSRTFPRDQRTLWGHPAGLYILFLTETWERFSYYGMRALLVLYMTTYLIPHAIGGASGSGISGGGVLGLGGLHSLLEAVYGLLDVQPFASQIYGLYTAFVYFTPLFGGILSDRVLGQKKTVVIGAVLMAIGHFLMAFESLFLVALAFLILGNGCFKPNISTQVGSLYPQGDARRDRGFTVFYMGVNLGAFFSPLVCGTLGQVYGWHYGFAAAGVGMVIGLGVYLGGQRFLAPLREGAVQRSQTRDDQKKQTSEGKAIVALLTLCLLTIVFWGVYEQQGNTLQLFADRYVDWHFFSWQIPSTWLQSIDPAFILLMAPTLNLFWAWLADKKMEPSTLGKMGWGCGLLGVAFLLLAMLTRGLGVDAKISALWIVVCIFIITIGELHLSPIGLSLVTKVAPARLVGLLMGVWLMAVFFGNYLAGYLGMYYERLPKETFFMVLSGIAIIASAAIFLLKGPLEKAMGIDS